MLSRFCVIVRTGFVPVPGRQLIAGLDADEVTARLTVDLSDLTSSRPAAVGGRANQLRPPDAAALVHKDRGGSGSHRRNLSGNIVHGRHSRCITAPPCRRERAVLLAAVNVSLFPTSSGSFPVIVMLLQRRQAACEQRGSLSTPVETLKLPPIAHR